jgi:hypothetical protein
MNFLLLNGKNNSLFLYFYNKLRPQPEIVFCNRTSARYLFTISSVLIKNTNLTKRKHKSIFVSFHSIWFLFILLQFYIHSIHKICETLWMQNLQTFISGFSKNSRYLSIKFHFGWIKKKNSTIRKNLCFLVGSQPFQTWNSKMYYR